VLINKGSDGQIFSVLLKHYEQPFIEKVIVLFLNDKDPFLQKTGHTIQMLRKRFDGYVEQLANPTQNQPTRPEHRIYTGKERSDGG